MGEFEGRKWLCKPVGRHVIRRDVIEVNKARGFDFSYEVVTYVDVLCTDVKFRVLSQRNGPLIVHANRDCLEPL